MKLVSYFGDWRDVQWQCEHCEWRGKGSELADGEMFSEVMERDCPRCHTPVVYYGFPTIAEARANWDKLPPLDRQLLGIAETPQRTFEQARLRDPSQLPDLAGDRLVLEWDCDKSGETIFPVDFPVLTPSTRKRICADPTSVSETVLQGP